MGTAEVVKGRTAKRHGGLGKTGPAAKRRGGVSEAAPAVSADQLRELLDQTLREVDADERAGSLLRAARIRMRLRIPDLGMVLNVAPSDEADHHLRWTFSEEGGPPKLDLTMDSRVANAYFQGTESLAIAIARRRAQASGDARCALLYVPALRLVVEKYRRLVSERHPELAVD
ncbi:MAG TPA: hypothetical protein VKG89_03685 [Solirubrobacterales bacterium]|nr:hypothetical protein [Solirubrobacterales bacterium]